MPRLRRLVLATCCAVTPLTAQQPDSAWTPRSDRPLGAIWQALAVNVVVNRFDAWVANQWWAYVGPDSWRRSIKLGWEWDENEFGTNMFAHPYHGGLYFNAARANGLDYWESAPVALLGSYTWEFFGEEHRPSLNDFFMTSFGGIALGEVFHRLGASIRNNRASGGARFWREIASMPLDPMGGLNRLLRGDWGRVGPNPPEHDPGAFVTRFGAGGRVAVDSGSTDTTSYSSAILTELMYGDPFTRPYSAPFDVFSLRAHITPEDGGLHQLRASGRLFGRSINRLDARHKHLFAVNQRYDYINNSAHRFGAQSVEAGIYSRWQLGRGSFGLRTQLFGDLILLGALDAPFSGVGERQYDFGPGVGFRADITLEKRGVPLVSLVSRTEWLHSISGAEADHLVAMGGTEITLPVYRRLGVGFYSSVYVRRSFYSDQPEQRREYPEFRLFLTYTTGGIPQPATSP